MHRKLTNKSRGCSKPVEVGPGRLRGLRPLTGLVGVLSTAMWLCAGCVVGLPTPECDNDGDGFCSEAVGNMPGGDRCDQLGDEGCGDATRPETIYPDAPEACDGIDSNCDGYDDSQDEHAHAWCASQYLEGHYCAGDHCIPGCTHNTDCEELDLGNYCEPVGGFSGSGRCICTDGIDNAPCTGNLICREVQTSVFRCVCGDEESVCGENEVCSINGSCTCGNNEPILTTQGEACPDTSNAPDCCDDQCVNTMTDTSHCGSCGKSCPANQVCCQGSCENGSGCPMLP